MLPRLRPALLAALTCTLACVVGPASASAGYYPTGPQTNVAKSALDGWNLCYQAGYDSTTSVATVLASCDGEKLLMGAGPAGASTLSVLAAAPRADVVFDTSTSNVPRDANGTGWYFSNSYSWGFAKQGDPIARNSCDTQSVNPALRLCWHTSSGNLSPGYRAGSVFPFDSSYTRYVYESQPPRLAAPSAVTFGPHAGSVTRDLTVTNTGVATVSLSAAAITGRDAGDFTLNFNGCLKSYAPNESCALKVTSSPSAAGQRVATLTLTGTMATPLAVSLTASRPTVSTGYYPVGPQAFVETSRLDGWQECYRGGYGATVAVSAILAQCDGDHLMLAGGETGSSTLAVLAAAPRADVTFDTGESDTPHVGNGAGWYYGSDESWGFALEGDPVNRNSCDVATANPGLRLCWHTAGGNVMPGWRAGAATGLFGNTWTRYVFEPVMRATLGPDSAFGAQQVGTVSSPRAVTMANTSVGALSIAGVRSTGASAGDFIVDSSACVGTLAPGQACDVSVRFAPSATGDRAAQLTATGDMGTLTANLAGTGVAPPPADGGTVVAPPGPGPVVAPSGAVAPIPGASGPGPVAVPPAPARVTNTVRATWRAGRRYTTVKTLTVRGAPKGSTIRLWCKGKGCPFKSKTLAHAKGGDKNVLRSFGKTRRRGKRKVFTPAKLRPGAVVTIAVTKPGHIGRAHRYVIRKSKSPTSTRLCVPVGAKTPRKSC